jgi:hypothetical protein
MTLKINTEIYDKFANGNVVCVYIYFKALHEFWSGWYNFVRFL